MQVDLSNQISALRVLIVDDEAPILMSIDYLLKKNGYQTFLARNGEEALIAIETFRPHILLLDLMMPKIDGYEVIQRIRSNPQHDSIRIIILSAKNKEIDIQMGQELGVDRYLTKPFSTKYLVEQIGELATEIQSI
jgi:DNA-binding response OmpR family regulator